MDTFSLYLAIFGTVVTCIGSIPVVLDAGLYWRKLLLWFTRHELLIEDVRVVFDVQSISKINVFYTGTYKVLKNSPTLLIPFKNIYGETNNVSVSIDNIPMTLDFYKEKEDYRAKCKLSDKTPGDKVLLELMCTFTAEAEDVDKENDALGFWLDNYRCRHLTLSIQFPRKFYPKNVRLADGKTTFDLESQKVRHSRSSPKPTLCARNRRLVEWDISYPKFKRSYKIYWSWI